MRLLVACVVAVLISGCSEGFEKRTRDIHREIAKQQVGSSPDWIIVKNMNMDDRVAAVFGTLDDRSTCQEIIDALNKTTPIGAFNCVQVKESEVLGRLLPTLFGTERNSDQMLHSGVETKLADQDSAADMAAEAAAIAADLANAAAANIPPQTPEPQVALRYYTPAESDAGPVQLESGQHAYKGYLCKDTNCSGHIAGYEWAKNNGITVGANCGNQRSESFSEGCFSYLLETQYGVEFESGIR